MNIINKLKSKVKEIEINQWDMDSDESPEGVTITGYDANTIIEVLEKMESSSRIMKSPIDYFCDKLFKTLKGDDNFFVEFNDQEHNDNFVLDVVNKFREICQSDSS